MSQIDKLCLLLCWTVISQILYGSMSPLEDSSRSSESFFLASIPDLGIHVLGKEGESLLYFHQGIHVSPRISPGGDRILLHSKRGGRIGIWLGNMQGGELRRLCDGDQASWSTDGAKIVFRREGRIYERDLLSGQEKIVSPPDFLACQFPSYLPKGRFLFVNSETIYMTDEAQGETTRLVSGQIRSAPRASPDGSKVIWQNGAHLAALDLNTGESFQFSLQGGIQSWPVWSQDGEYLAYCQSSLSEGPWDLYVTSSKSPEEAWLVRRGIHPGLDWKGTYTPDSNPVSLPKSYLVVRATESPSGVEPVAWSDVEIPQTTLQIPGGLRIENRWLGATFDSRNAVFKLFPTEESGAHHLLEVSPLMAARTALGKTPMIQLESYTRDNAELILNYASTESAPIKMSLRFSENRPLIELGCERPQKISLKTEIECALIPDRFASDLLLDPRSGLAPEIALPYAELFLAPMRGGSGVLMIVTPDSEQRIQLRSTPQSFNEIIITTGVSKVFVALLAGSEYWREITLSRAKNGDGWRAEWTHPFLAQWRLTTALDMKGQSRMWSEESLSRHSNPFLPVDGPFRETPQRTVVYLFGRTWHTPLPIVTPVDLVIDAVGFEPGISLLDEDGIRSYRTGSEPVSFREITTREEQWSRELVHVDSRDPNWVELGILESMQGLRAVDTPGVRSLITHLGKDIVRILQGLENRITEYESFLNQLRVFCRSREPRTKDDADLLATIDRRVTALQNRVERLSVSKITLVKSAISEILGALGTSRYLHSTKEYAHLSKVVRASQSDRLEVIGAYREFAKEVRSEAGRAIIGKPDLESVADHLRKMTKSILRNRYYLEGDWGGEKPLRKETN